MHKESRRLGEILATFALLAAGCQQQPPRQRTGAATELHRAAMQIGGEDVLTLTRKATNSGSKPEFLSVTLLPGRGMNMFQVTAAIPGKGEIPLLPFALGQGGSKPTERHRQGSSWATLPSASEEPF